MAEKRLIVKIDTGLHKKVKMLAVQRDESMASLIERAINDYINHNGEKQ